MNAAQQPTDESVTHRGRTTNSIRKRKRLWSGVGLVGVVLGLVVLVAALTKRSARSSSSASPPTSVSHQSGRGSGTPGSNAGRCRTFCDTEEPSSSPTESPSTRQPTQFPSLLPSETPTNVPTSLPSSLPSSQPTRKPSRSPTKGPSASPTSFPTHSPTREPTQAPTLDPTDGPTNTPTNFPSLAPSTEPPTDPPTRIAFDPGDLTVNQNGLLLSTGLTSRLLAITGQHVLYDNNLGQSTQVFHKLPDFGATFADPNNPGGWIYVSNSEVRQHEGFGQGGVGAFTFDEAGNLVDYKRILDGTTANCGGGRTPWGAWISCEEYGNGKVWQVDPTGSREPEVITLGSDGGVFESFAYDVRDTQNSAFFVTEDHLQGALQRFRPDAPDWKSPWSILLGSGTIDFLLLHPDGTGTGGTFEWTSDRELAKANAEANYPNSEGIDVYEGDLYFVSKRHRTMMTLDLDNFTYKVESTRSGLFNAGPDQIKRILNDDSNLLFFTEDGGPAAGIHARNDNGDYLTILESRTYFPETTGLSFSPDGRAMYIAYQGDGMPNAVQADKTGYLFEIRREDGLPFNGRTLNVNYHATADQQTS